MPFEAWPGDPDDLSENQRPANDEYTEGDEVVTLVCVCLLISVYLYNPNGSTGTSPSRVVCAKIRSPRTLKVLREYKDGVQRPCSMPLEKA